MHFFRSLFALAMVFLFLTSCSTTPNPPKDLEKKPEPTEKPSATLVSSHESKEIDKTLTEKETIPEAPNTDEIKKNAPQAEEKLVKKHNQQPESITPQTALKSAEEEEESTMPSSTSVNNANNKTHSTEGVEKTTSNKPNHSIWNSELQKYVSSTGKVNYKSWKGNRGQLDTYLKDLAAHPPQSDWSRNDKMAYWINAYNAFTIDLILNNYPLSSITKLDGGKTWDVKRIELGNKMYSLNNIENDILRPVYKDARIHFAVNCAAKSCPPLLNKAFLPNTLNSQLATQSKKFINNTNYNSIAGNSVKVSKIFEWYASDFGNLINYLNKYSKVQIQSSATINFAEYNWALNE